MAARIRMNGVSDDALIPTPPVGKASLFYNSVFKVYRAKLDDGSVITLSSDPELIQDTIADAISAGVQDGISVTYNDPGNALNFVNIDKGSVAVTTHEAALDPHPQYETEIEVQAKVDAHANLTNNPHGVTKTQVGLGNVDNTSDINKPVSTAQAAADTAVQNFSIQRSNHTGTQLASTISDFNSAVSIASPVQSVAGKTGVVLLVKDDVGLNNVDNTSDLSKPISTATQAALDLKADITSLGNLATLDTVGTSEIDNDSVTNANLSNMAPDTIKGRVSTSGDPQDLSVSQVLTLLNVETTTQLNARDTANRDRANHTGTQLANTILDLSEEVQDIVGSLIVDGPGISSVYDDLAGTLTIESTITQYTDEQAQDAVGNILNDSSSIDFIYNDALNSITAEAIPSGINHNSLLNYVPNQHIDHSLVSVNAGAGLVGGGDLTSSKTISMPNTGTPGTFGSASLVPVITTDAQGRVSSATNTSIQISESQVTNLTTNLAAKANLSGGNTFSNNQIINGGLSVTSTTEGFLPPRLTTTQRDALVSPTNGLLIYNTTAEKLQIYENNSWVSYQEFFNPTTTSYFFDDFITGLNTSLGWTVTQTGGAPSGATVQTGSYGVDTIQKAIGVLQLDTGNSSSGRSAISRSVNHILFGYSSVEMTIRMALEQLSIPTERFTIWAGFMDVPGPGNPVDGVYWTYNDSLGPNWFCVTRSNNVQTSTDSGVPADTLYSRFKILVNSTGTVAEFFINDTLVATNTTNIPNSSGRETGIGIKIAKEIGSTEYAMSVDYYTHTFNISGGRS